jgi:hypothetical protein
MPRHQASERHARYRKRRRAGFQPVVSEGDSWFDYPFFLNVIDRIDDEEMFAHFRLEASGDTVRNMIGTAAAVKNLRVVIEEERPICLLFSGGGNDVASAANRGLLFRQGTGTDPLAYLEPEGLEHVFGRLEASYTALIATIGPVAPILVHGYDHFTPSDAPVKFVGIDLPIGPWIFPAMVDVGITDRTLGRALGRVLIDHFNSVLVRLAAAHPLDLVHVDLRGTLDIERDWENEIHPTRDGFKKVAAKFVAQIKQRLPTLLSERVQRRLVAND